MNFITMADLIITYIIMIQDVHFIIMVQDRFLAILSLDLGFRFWEGWQQDCYLTAQEDHRHFTRTLHIIRIRHMAIILIDKKFIY